MARSSADRVVVVGAGIGGLVAALELTLRGLDVTLLEAADGPGGKMRALSVAGQRIDAGPTVFTMRWVFDRILADAGTTLEALVDLQPLRTLARHAWRGSDATLDLHADAGRSAEAIAAFASPAEARRFTAFCDQARRVYQRLEGPHIRSSRPSFTQMVADLGPRGLAELAALGPFASLWHSLGRHFHDARLRQLFARYATYCGASPWLAPATLMLVAHVEQDGVWSITGGMDMLAQRLAALAAVRGARLRYGATVRRIELRGGAVSAVHLDDGERLAADHVVFNGDADALSQGLLGPDLAARLPPVLPPARRSLSALTWVMSARTQGLPLVRHNVFFDDDYASEFDDIFRHRRLPRRGTVYVCAQDRADGDEPAPVSPERLLVLVNAPADGDHAPLSDMEMDRCTERMRALLKACRLNLEPTAPSAIQRRGPAEFARLFPGSGGALYGPATHGWMALFRRPGAATAIPGLYLAGGSAHPGPGVPMAAMSGSLAAATLMARRDSTSRLHRVHISGGTSTPSATTVATHSR